MESLHYLLMKTHTVLQRRISSRASEMGLTPGQPKVLDYLFRYGESDQKTIASYCEIEQATAGSILIITKLIICLCKFVVKIEAEAGGMYFETVQF